MLTGDNEQPKTTSVIYLSCKACDYVNLYPAKSYLAAKQEELHATSLLWVFDGIDR